MRLNDTQSWQQRKHVIEIRKLFVEHTDGIFTDTENAHCTSVLCAVCVCVLHHYKCNERQGISKWMHDQKRALQTAT